MKRIVFCAAVACLFVGCASSNTMEVRLRQMKAELNETMRSQMRDQIENMKAEIREVDARNKNEIKEMSRGIGKDMADLKKSIEKEMSDIKETQKKHAVETDKTLIDQQKQIFQSKTVIDDSARRVYLLESIITSRGTVASHPTREGFVTYVESKKVSVSLGSSNGVRAGDQYAVYKNKDKIGLVEIEIVELESSSGNIVKSSKPISVGDRIEQEKK